MWRIGIELISLLSIRYFGQSNLIRVRFFLIPSLFNVLLEKTKNDRNAKTQLGNNTITKGSWRFIGHKIELGRILHIRKPLLFSN